MRLTLKILIIFFISVVSSSSKEHLYYKIGLFDYKHETGGMALNIKNVTDNTFNLLNLGELSQIYEFTGFIDKNNWFSKGEQIKKREEYSIYLSSGLQKKIDLSQKISLVPSFSIGLYEEFDDGKDMGYPVEFKSEIELNYNLSKSSLFGVTWNHISNADIGGTNPGSDSVLINFIIKE